MLYVKNYLSVFDFHYLQNKPREETLNYSITSKNPVVHRIIILFV